MFSLLRLFWGVGKQPKFTFELLMHLVTGALTIRLLEWMKRLASIEFLWLRMRIVMSINLSDIPSVDSLRGFRRSWPAHEYYLGCRRLVSDPVGRQPSVHGLETALGVKLFERTHRAIRFTPEGEQLFVAADSAMQQLQDALGFWKTTSVGDR